MKNDKKEQSRLINLYINLGLELIVAVAIGGLGGYWLDRWLTTTPVFMIVGFFLGMIAGFRNFFLAIKSDMDYKGK